MLTSLEAAPQAPCSREDFIRSLEKACTPKKEWLVGIEHEAIPFARIPGDVIPVTYKGPHGLADLMEHIRTLDPLWAPIVEGQTLIGLRHKTGKKGFSLEPGGQFEFDGSPLATVHEVAAQLYSCKDEVQKAAKPLDIDFLTLGTTPLWPREAIPRMPKKRYAIMAGYMPLVGEKGLDMMLRTAASQVSLDFDSEADMVSKLRLSLALQPLVTALFANSPFLDGQPTGWVSTRAACWQATDPHRTGLLPFAFEGGMGFERYIDWALSVPMYCVYRSDKCYDVTGASFSDFLAGKLPGLEGYYPTENDWNYHLTTLFPEVRLKHVLEMRGADAGPLPMMCALTALWVGLLYDAESLEAAWNHVRFWTPEERTTYYKEASRTGLQTPIPGGTIHQLALSIVDIAAHGLKKRGLSEEVFLDPLRPILDTGRSQADELLSLYHGSWEGSVMPAFSTCVHA